jgi:hypothetical protein
VVLPISQRSWALFLAGGCALWVGLAFLRTRRMAEMIGASESEVRALGARDALNGLALVLSGDPRPAVGTRVLFDLTDAARYGRGRPKVLAMTLGFAAVGAVGLFARRR